MQYNILSYWQSLENMETGDPECPKPRVLRLLQATFERWQAKKTWLDQDQMGHLFDRFQGEELERVKALPIAERRGLAIREMLDLITTPAARKQGVMRIHPDEIIVGASPPYSVGQGKELMRYLSEEEALFYQLQFLNEWSPFGHIVPNYEKLLKLGIDGILEDCRRRHRELTQKGQKPEAEKKGIFYRSVETALEGVKLYAARYAELAEEYGEKYGRIADQMATRNQRRETGHSGSERRFASSIVAEFPEKLARQRQKEMAWTAERLRKCPTGPAETFMEAVQAFYLVHCALHFTGDITSIGRLDQILYPYYKADLEAGRITPEVAQEVLDCLWIKLDEQAVLDRRQVEDRFTCADGALLGSGGASNFDQGALTNQWMQQVTIGGVLADSDPQPTDATNELTYMCLASSRRMPLNSPTLDLRVHQGTPPELLEAAAKTLLSGGAHPVLLNDDRLIPALHEKSGGTVALASARNYVCDGCFETLFPGESEFSFGFVPALDVLEKALNSGAGFASAGATYYRGTKGSWRTPAASRIGSFEELWAILRRHILLGSHRFLAGVLGAYGYKEPVSPSPLLSALIDGCLESGRDLAGGGSRYHVFAPLMTGISTAADSLYAIRKLVFEEEAFSLEELVSALRSNWGANEAVIGRRLSRERCEEIKALCRAQPKFGHGVEEVDEIAWRLIETFNQCIQEVRQAPVHAAGWASLRERYDADGQPFEILFTPGVGTFEQYVFGGAFAGASADGRNAFKTIASDMSPAPLHDDEEPLVEEEGGGLRHRRETRLLDALKSYADRRVDLLSDGAPADLNIREDFPLDKLVEALAVFARGEGGNVLTVTVANPETLAAADQDPDSYNMVRVRMGGWSEFFMTLFPDHRAQHRRRPLFTA